jgi:hypothetical protein
MRRKRLGCFGSFYYPFAAERVKPGADRTHRLFR